MMGTSNTFVWTTYIHWSGFLDFGSGSKDDDSIMGTIHLLAAGRQRMWKLIVFRKMSSNEQ